MFTILTSDCVYFTVVPEASFRREKTSGSGRHSIDLTAPNREIVSRSDPASDWRDILITL